MRLKTLALAMPLVVFVGCAPRMEIHKRGWIGGVYKDMPQSSWFSGKRYPLTRFSHQVSSREGVRALLARRAVRLDRRRVSNTLRIQSDGATQSRKVLTSSQQIPGEKTGLSKAVAESHDGGVLVTQSFAATPAESGGLKEGDLILAVNGETVETTRDLYRIVEASEPRSRLNMNVYRLGRVLDLDVPVGVENYQKYHTLLLGLWPNLSCDLFPNPDFNLFGLVTYERKTGQKRRKDFRAPVEALKMHDPQKPEENPRQKGDLKIDKLWHFRLAIFAVSKHWKIVEQNPLLQ